MRLAAILMAVAGAVLTTGCSRLVSLNPAVTDTDSSMDPALVGTWTCDDTIVTVKAAGTAYEVTYVEKSDDKTTVNHFDARLLQVQGAEILDLVSKEDDPFQVPVHVFMRVWPEGTSLRVAFLDSAWLRGQAARQLAAQDMQDRTLITAPTEKVRDFLLQYGADEGSFSELAVLEKHE